MLSGFFRLEPFTATQQVILNNNYLRQYLRICRQSCNQIPAPPHKPTTAPIIPYFTYTSEGIGSRAISQILTTIPIEQVAIDISNNLIRSSRCFFIFCLHQLLFALRCLHLLIRMNQQIHQMFQVQSSFGRPDTYRIRQTFPNIAVNIYWRPFPVDF